MIDVKEGSYFGNFQCIFSSFCVLGYYSPRQEKMQYELVVEICSTNNVQAEWGSSDKGDDIDRFFLMWEATICCTQKVFFDLCLLLDRQERSTENMVTVINILTVRLF